MSEVRVVVQSRLLSHRLPAKALLPIGGYPCVVLCAKRAGNTGLPVVIATSDHSSDDLIVAAANQHQIPVVRGSEDDVLARFITALGDATPDTIVVRLTADNVIPDGEFVEAMVSHFIKKSCTYLGTHSPIDGLPYGLSAEVFRYSGLLEAAEKTPAGAPGREHVTTYLRNHSSAAIFDSIDAYVNMGSTTPRYLSQLRCTIDSIDDYLNMARVMDCRNPVRISWRNLLDRLAALPEAPQFRVGYTVREGKVMSRLTLGTAQLGLTYGAANESGMPSFEEARDIVTTAIEHGVTLLDSARAYGESEHRLGKILKGSLADRASVYTKLEPMDATTASCESAKAFVEASVFRSLFELQIGRLPCLMLHRWEDYTRANGEIWRTVLQLRDRGLIEKLGSSVYSPEEALEALADRDIQHIQIPYNILDYRWHSPEVQNAIAARPDVTIHARSVLLQGVLTASKDKWPKVPGLDADSLIDALDALTRKYERLSRTDLCIAFVAGQSWITSMVVGCETVAQLNENLLLSRNPSVQIPLEEIPNVPVDLLDPRKWPKP